MIRAGGERTGAVIDIKQDEIVRRTLRAQQFGDIAGMHRDARIAQGIARQMRQRAAIPFHHGGYQFSDGQMIVWAGITQRSGEGETHAESAD